ncbi:MAG: carbon monoxide dehydrogenase [Alphaproteobacteria bacterium]|jgi:carbon monoxide dehydrogenase subunit G|nr:carbon monoxide dehydrogenase [Alphaproteobacteria bacterium]
MDMSGEYRIAAPRQDVWQALHDPAVLRQCIEGCETLEKRSETEMAGKMLARVGPVKARFEGTMTLSDVHPPERYTVSGEAKGGAAGFAKGRATITLLEEGSATLLKYDLHANVGGKLAQIGARLIAATAKKIADEFFSRFSGLVAPAEPVPAPVGEEAIETEPLPPPARPGLPPPAGESEGRRGLSPLVWIGGVILLVGLLIYAFS